MQLIVKYFSWQIFYFWDVILHLGKYGINRINASTSN
jgi:hypothetical protein